MRFLLISLAALLLAFVVKVDLQDGTIPMASFYKEEKTCEQPIYQYVTAVVHEDDTIYSLFAATPSPVAMTFPERLAQFYKLNPHLQLQALLPGNVVRIPLLTTETNLCTN